MDEVQHQHMRFIVAHRQQLESIMDDMVCARDFACCQSELKDLCKGKDSGLAGHLDCLDERGPRCTFSVSFRHGRLCKCPLRVYLGKTLKV